MPGIQVGMPEIHSFRSCPISTPGEDSISKCMIPPPPFPRPCPCRCPCSPVRPPALACSPACLFSPPYVRCGVLFVVPLFPPLPSALRSPREQHGRCVSVCAQPSAASREGQGRALDGDAAPAGERRQLGREYLAPKPPSRPPHLARPQRQEPAAPRCIYLDHVGRVGRRAPSPSFAPAPPPPPPPWRAPLPPLTSATPRRDGLRPAPARPPVPAPGAPRDPAPPQHGRARRRSQPLEPAAPLLRLRPTALASAFPSSASAAPSAGPGAAFRSST